MSKIQWTDTTWNPVTGCVKVSAGCKNCYASRLAPRVFAGQTVGSPGRPRRFTDVRCHPERLGAPLRWRKPRRVFVNSMSDLFHEDVPDEFIARVFDVMRQCPQHTFQVLTKRPERMRDVARRLRFDSAGAGATFLAMDDNDRSYPLMPHRGSSGMPQVWLGVSCEDQDTADERIPMLLDTPASVRFVSAEPLLSEMDLRPWLSREWPPRSTPDGYHSTTLTALDWVIIGGESGPKARPCNVEWIRSIVEQCRDAGTPAFVKQLGRVVHYQGAPCQTRHRDRKGGDPAEWPEDLRVREWPVDFTPQPQRNT